MNLHIIGSLAQLNKSFRLFKHNGKSMSKEQVKRVLEYGLKKGYEETDEITSEEIDIILLNLEKESVSRSIKNGTLSIITANGKKYKVDKNCNTWD